MIYTIKNECLCAKIIDLGAELTSVTNNNGKEYIFQPSPIWPGQAKNLFPNVGAVKEEFAIIRGKKYPMYQHGFAKTMVFEANQLSETSIEFALKTSEATKEYLPYNFTFIIKFELSGNMLKQEYIITNNEDEPMYFGVACHTGFATTPKSYVDCGENDKLVEIIRKDMLYLTGEEIDFETEQGKIPVIPKYFGNGAHILKNFKEKSLELINPELSSSVKIEFEDFDYITLWSTEDAETVLCMMPWCALPDCDDTNHVFEEKKGNKKLEGKESFKALQKFYFIDL